jgi:hypothetical protein
MCSGSTLTHRTRKGGMGIRQAWLPEMEGKSVPSRLLDLAIPGVCRQTATPLKYSLSREGGDRGALKLSDR